MKRYLLFGWETYAYDGGWHDFLGSFDEADHAKQAGEKKRPSGCRWTAQVIDHETGEVQTFLAEKGEKTDPRGWKVRADLAEGSGQSASPKLLW